MTHRSGNGFGQVRSATYRGELLCARDEDGPPIKTPTVNAANAPTLRDALVFMRLL
jgi:hypothetical protein